IFITQPIVDYTHYLKDLIVKTNTTYIAQKAAVEGTITPALRNEVIDNLKAVGFREDEIEIEFDSSVYDRGNRLDVIIRAERPGLFVYNFSGLDGPNYYYGHDYIMSEYLD